MSPGKSKLDNPPLPSIRFIGFVNRALGNRVFIEQMFNFDLRLAMVRIENQPYGGFSPVAVVAQFPTSDDAKHAPGQQGQANSAATYPAPMAIPIDATIQMVAAVVVP